MTPLRFFVHCGVSKRTQSSDGLAVDTDRGGGDFRSRWFIHERHELVRETRHRAADADTSDVRASPDASHPAALWHVAIDNWSPAAQFHDALWRAVHFRKITLLVIACAIAP